MQLPPPKPESKKGQMLLATGAVGIDSCEEEASGLVVWILMIGADDFRDWNFWKWKTSILKKQKIILNHTQPILIYDITV